jgi:hypothetical protein
VVSPFAFPIVLIILVVIATWVLKGVIRIAAIVAIVAIVTLFALRSGVLG